MYDEDVKETNMTVLEKLTIRGKVRELKNARYAPPHYLASDCWKSFHGHCVQEKQNGFFHYWCRCVQTSILFKKEIESHNVKPNIEMLLPVVSKNKDGPEHCALGSPVKWPKYPTIQAQSSCCQGNDDSDIS